MKNRRFQEFNVGRAGSGRIDLQTGSLNFVHPITNPDDNVLPVAISQVYRSDWVENGESLYGKGFRLNLQQKLVQDPSDETKWTYIDGLGDEYKFKARYFYRGERNERVYLPENTKPSEIEIRQDGRLFQGSREVFADMKSNDGLTLKTNLLHYNGNEKIETRPGEVVQLEEEIKSMRRNLDTILYTLERFNEMHDEEFKKLRDIQRELEGRDLPGNERVLFEHDANQFNSSSRLDKNGSLTEIQRTVLELKKLHSLVTRREHRTGQHVITSALGLNSQGSRLRFADEDGRFAENLNDGMQNRRAYLADNDSDAPNTLPRDNREQKRHQDIFTDRTEWINQRFTDFSNILQERTFQKQGEFNDQMCVVETKRAIEDVDVLIRMLAQKEFVLGELNQHLPENFITTGNGIVLGFNKVGKLISMQDSFENKATIIFKDERIDRVVCSGDKEIKFEYAGDVLQTIVDFRGRRTSFNFTSGQLQTVVYPDGQVSSFSYGNQSNLIERIIPPMEIGVQLTWGNSQVQSFSIVNKDEQVKENSTARLTYTGAQTSVSYDTGVAEEFHFENERITRERVVVENNPRADVAYVYGSATRNGEEVNTITITEQALGNGTGNNTTCVEYKNEGEPLFETAMTFSSKVAGGEVVGEVKTVVETIFEYRDRKLIRTESTINIDGQTENRHEVFEYDKSGNLIRSIDSDGNINEPKTSSFYYKQNPGSRFYTQRVFAENGRLLSEFDGRGENKTEFRYQGTSNIVQGIIDPTGVETNFGRCPHTDRVLSLTQGTEHGERNQTIFCYEQELLKKLESGNTAIEYKHDNWGRIKEILVDSRQFAKYDHRPWCADAKQYSIIATYSTGDVFETVTNLRGMVTSVFNTPYQGDRKLLHSFTYDNLDRLSQVVDKKTDTVTDFAYDRCGNVIKSKNNQLSITQDINARRNVVFSEYLVETPVETVSKKYGFSYDEQDRLVEINLPNGAKQGIGYDSLGRVEKVSSPFELKRLNFYQKSDKATTLVSSVFDGNEKTVYRYDSRGNIIEILRNNKSVAKYKYDALNRLAKDGETEIEYDTNGNILFKGDIKYTYEGDRLVSFGEEKFAYDSQGNPTLYRDVKLGWGNVRNLERYGKYEFEYDASGQRTAKIQGTKRTEFFYNGMRLLAESRRAVYVDLHLHADEDAFITVGDPSYTAVTQRVVEYLYGVNGVQGMIANGKSYWYRKNVQGDVTHIFDEGGELVARYEYDAWGKHRVENYTCEEIGEMNPFRYRGYYYDVETGLYYLNTRYYDPEVGRFINMDRIDILDITRNMINGLNLYAYCGNNPVMFSDPTGMIRDVSSGGSNHPPSGGGIIERPVWNDNNNNTIVISRPVWNLPVGGGMNMGLGGIGGAVMRTPFWGWVGGVIPKKPNIPNEIMDWLKWYGGPPGYTPNVTFNERRGPIQNLVEDLMRFRDNLHNIFFRPRLPRTGIRLR